MRRARSGVVTGGWCSRTHRAHFCAFRCVIPGGADGGLWIVGDSGRASAGRGRRPAISPEAPGVGLRPLRCNGFTLPVPAKRYFVVFVQHAQPNLMAMYKVA